MQQAAAQQNNRILPGISHFAWNKDCSQVALSPNSLEIWIFNTNSTADISKWERVQVLKEVCTTHSNTFIKDMCFIAYDCLKIIVPNDVILL